MEEERSSDFLKTSETISWWIFDGMLERTSGIVKTKKKTTETIPGGTSGLLNTIFLKSISGCSCVSFGNVLHVICLAILFTRLLERAHEKNLGFFIKIIILEHGLLGCNVVFEGFWKYLKEFRKKKYTLCNLDKKVHGCHMISVNKKPLPYDYLIIFLYYLAIICQVARMVKSDASY